jgi:hypothetical protein
LYRYREGGKELQAAGLPPMPAGFTYTDFVVVKGGLILAWEESDFTDVGAAGLLFLTDLEFRESSLP